MIKGDYSRVAKRAPLWNEVLVVKGDDVRKVRAFNISERGILFEEASDLEVGDQICIVIDLHKLVEFKNMDEESLIAFKNRLLDRNIFRLKAKIVRHFTGKAPVDNTEVQQLGASLLDLSDTILNAILEYVEMYKTNVYYLLHLIEKLGRTTEHQSIVKKVADLLGYDSSMKVSHLRQLVLHDYQSLYEA